MNGENINLEKDLREILDKPMHFSLQLAFENNYFPTLLKEVMYNQPMRELRANLSYQIAEVCKQL